MSMPPVVFNVTMFRGDYDQARSQLTLLWLMEALCRINQSHIRQARGMAKRGIGKPYPPIYRSGIHYEREQKVEVAPDLWTAEEWPDIPKILEKKGLTFPGAWGDCLPVSTLVLRDDWSFVPIGVLQPGERIAADGQWTTVLDHAITGEKTILAFDLNNGATLRCSPDHRLFKVEKEEVVELRAEDVKPGDHLLTPRSPIPTGEEWTDELLSPTDFAWMLGTFVADGWAELPRHPRFSISGKDSKPKRGKVEQKQKVKEIAEAAGITTRWHERYVSVNDRRLAEIMAACGKCAPNKYLPTLRMSLDQVRAVLEGLKTDASISDTGTVTHGTTSPMLALQLRVLYRMLGQSTHIKRWDNHGGLGTHPIYRIGVRRTEEEVGSHQRSIRTSARVVAIRENGEELCADISTDVKSFWLPESDLIVHNCEDVGGWRGAELRELPWHYEKLVAGKRIYMDPRYPQPGAGLPSWSGWRKVRGGIKAKPFARWKRDADGSYHYHALVLLPDGRIEDPSLALGMGREAAFAANETAEKMRTGVVPVKLYYVAAPKNMILDPERGGAV